MLLTPLSPLHSQGTHGLVRDHGISVRDVTVAYGSATPVLSQISLEVRSGEFLALVGASGCGKTTLMNVIAGLVQPRSGNVLVNGHPPVARQRDVAYVLARDALLPWRTVCGNVEYALMLSGIEKVRWKPTAQNFLQSVGLSAHKDKYPAQLSHGQRQRVALARAFAVDRDVYLLDEPFSALDAQTKLMLHDQLLALWEASRKTVVFVTHDIG